MNRLENRLWFRDGIGDEDVIRCVWWVSDAGDGVVGVDDRVGDRNLKSNKRNMQKVYNNRAESYCLYQEIPSLKRRAGGGGY